MSDDGSHVSVAFFFYDFITSSATIQYNTIASKYQSILTSDDGLHYVSVAFSFYDFITSSATITQ